MVHMHITEKSMSLHASHTRNNKKEQFQPKVLTFLNNFRQWMLQRAIEKAENDDFSEVRLLQKVLKTPFKAHPEAESAGYAKPVPDWSKRLLLSCSS